MPATAAPRPGPLTFSLAGLTPADRLLALESIILWDAATGASFVEVPDGAVLRFPSGLTATSAVSLTGAALGVAGAGSASAQVPALRAADIASAQLLWGTPADETALGLVWRWDAGLDALRVDGLAAQGRRLLGTDGRDAIFAGRGDDQLLGGAGDDLLSGGGGADYADGGAGRDVLLVPFLRAEAPADFRWNRISAPNGDVTFERVEVLDLRDGDWILDSSHPAARADAVYRALLHRPADGSGLTAATAAIEAGASLSQLAFGILASEEYRARFGAPDAAALELAATADLLPVTATPLWLPDAEAALVGRLFHFVAGRLPTRTELLRWTDALEDGDAFAVVGAFLADHAAPGDAGGWIAFLDTLPARVETDALTSFGLRFTPSTVDYVIM